MEFRLSKFGHALTGETGVGQLMSDIGEAIAAAANSDRPFHALGGGNPGSIAAVEAIFSRRLAELADDPATLRSIVGGYDSPHGDLQFLEALAGLLKNHCGWDVVPENIMLTNGSQSAFFMIFNLLAGNHADGRFRHIVLPLTPEYIGYTDTGVDGDIFRSSRPKIELLDDNQFKYSIDFEALTLSDDAAAICLSRPTNPSGNVVTDQELKRLQQIALDGGVPLIIDAAYGLPFPGMVYGDVETVWNENCIACLSLSKLGLPGIRTGIVVAAPQFVTALAQANAIMNLASGSFGPGMTRELVRSGEILEIGQKHIRPFYEQRMQQALEWLHQYLGDLRWRVHKPEGAFFLWLWFPDLPADSTQLYTELKSRGVLVIDGQHFFPGLQDDGWRHRRECIRITYSQSSESVERGIELIGQCVRECYEHAPARPDD